MFRRLDAWLLARLRRGRAAPTIEATAEGFVVRPGNGTVVDVPWSSVRRAAAYKRDLYTADAIMLLLECDPPGPPLIEVSETWPGFATLFAGLEHALGVSPAWYLEIMVPVFEPTPRLLYERPGRAGGDAAAERAP